MYGGTIVFSDLLDSKTHAIVAPLIDSKSIDCT